MKSHMAEQPEKEAGQIAVAPRKADPKKKRKPSSLPPYHVILLNDDDHTHEYVIEMLKVIFAYPQEKGFLMAEKVHYQGKCIVFTTHKERAEFKRDQIHAYGADHRVATCRGSMTAIIEAAEV
jgi:ATP-dependent Clp protease adaptor protein ClpS